MKSASGKRPPDEAHGSGEEIIRPQQCSEAWGSREKKVHTALCSATSDRDCDFCTYGIQLKNNEKRVGQASSGRSTRPRKRSYQTAAAMPGGVAKRGCTRARCSTSGNMDYADSKDNACDARHGAWKVQKARCSASTSKNWKISFFILFRE